MYTFLQRQALPGVYTHFTRRLPERTPMTKPKLTVLDGGRILPVNKMHRVFLSAYVTDTRLMGVLAVCARWNIIAPSANRNDPDSWEDLYQFIYIDCEEAGFETYQQVRGDCAEEARRIETAMICGLGAKNTELNQRQLSVLLQHWHAFNQKNRLPMPPGAENYGFLLDPVIETTPEEEYALMQMICEPVRTDEQAVNYFLMRCFGRDYEGARFLTGAADPDRDPNGPGADLPLDLYDRYVCATFCRNAIDERRTFPDGATEYLCESLIEMNGSYNTVISKVTVRNLRVVGFEHCSRFPVSEEEAAMMLKKPEFVTVYEVFLSEEDMDDNIDEFTLGFNTTMTDCAGGRLFMSFRKTNDHVNSRLFRLANDVRGLYFLTDHNQLILCAYSLPEIYNLEKSIASSPLAPYLIVSARYEFRDPILYEFMNSDFEHFEDFLEMLRDD